LLVRLVAPNTDPEGRDVGADTGLGFAGDGPAGLLDQLEEAGGPADPVPSADGWELVLAESVAYLVDDRRRWQALADLRRVVGLDPEQILAAPSAVLFRVAAGERLSPEVPARQRAYQLLRRHGQTVCRRKDPACASCAIAGDCPSAGHPPPLY